MQIKVTKITIFIHPLRINLQRQFYKVKVFIKPCVNSDIPIIEKATMTTGHTLPSADTKDKYTTD